MDDGCALDLAPAGLHKLHGCASEGEIGDFDDLVIEWTWTGLAAVPELNDVWSTPTIGQLTDDNGDGVIDGNDGPDIALIAFHESNENPGGGATTPPSSCWTARPEPSTGTSWT